MKGVEGNYIEGKENIFPPKVESLKYGCKLFLEYYKEYTREQLDKERKRLLERLENSKQYTGRIYHREGSHPCLRRSGANVLYKV